MLDKNKTARCLRGAWVWFWVLGLHEAAPEGLLLSPFPRFLYSKTAASVYSHTGGGSLRRWAFATLAVLIAKGKNTVAQTEQ